MTDRRPLVVVGGGPGGMAAAAEAARAGLACTLIDEAPRLGGQIYRQVPADQPARRAQGGGGRGDELRAELVAMGDAVEVLFATSVLGLWPGPRLLWSTDGTAGQLAADQVIVAVGAHERPVPFPGWTLPGVMAAGGVQALISTSGLRPGRRALVAGAGPLIVNVARRLIDVGVEVVAVLEAGSAPWSGPTLVDPWEGSEVGQQTSENWRVLQRAGVRLLKHHTVFAAHGESGVTAATYGPVTGDDWRPRRDEAVTVEVDLVVVGFGFVPNSELAELAGCAQEPHLDGWATVRDATMHTTVAGVYAVGDCASAGGPLAAEEEGRIAGITAAERSGLLTAGEAERRRAGPAQRLAALGPLLQALEEVTRPRAGLGELAEHDTVLSARVNLYETDSFGNQSVVGVCSLGSLIHTAVGSAGGCGGWRTKRSGCWA